MAVIALISDIHGNIDAFRAVVEAIRSDGDIAEIVCLGDTIGYCPGGNEVIELLASLEEEYAIRYNLGSHDGAALELYQFIDMTNDTDAETLRSAGLESEEAVVTDYFDAENRRFVPVRPDARDAMMWTLEHLSDGARGFLRERLKPVIEIAPGIISVHGSPRDTACEYVRDARFARKCIESPKMDGIRLCFVGHTHLPVVWRMKRGEIAEVAGRRVCLSPPRPDFSERVQFERARELAIANVGSVGQPRDRDPRACHARFSAETSVFEHVRTAYDVEAAASRIRAAGFSERLAERLFRGA